MIIGSSVIQKREGRRRKQVWLKEVRVRKAILKLKNVIKEDNVLF